MSDPVHTRLRLLVERLGRLAAAEDWSGALNPSQLAALRFLSRANRFSRSPSMVAQYLGTTRGTTSQTLQALARKGLLREVRSEIDRRSLGYDLTPAGIAALDRTSMVDAALAMLPDAEAGAVADGLDRALTALLVARGGRSFGICRSCRHHEVRDEAGWCRLLRVDLAPEETGRLCREHEAPA